MALKLKTRTAGSCEKIKSADLQPLLIDINGVAVRLSMSVASVRRHVETGLIPPGVKIGRSRRWRVADIERWVAGDCQPSESVSSKNVP